MRFKEDYEGWESNWLTQSRSRPRDFENRAIYYGKATSALFSDHFSLNRTTIRLKFSKNLPQNGFS